MSTDHATARALVSDLYRGILGREPDENGLAGHAARLVEGRTLAEVIRTFLQSDEYKNRTRGDGFGPIDFDPPLRITLDAPPASIARLWAHIGANWAALGDIDPYWSVLSNPEFRLANQPDAAVLERFYASGKHDLARIEAWFSRNHRSLAPGMVVAEYGIGLGRLTRWLAPACAELRGFDISPPHMARARAWLDRNGIYNVTEHLVRRPDDLDALAGTDLFVSFLVLQHNPPPVIAHILDRAFSHLNPGGFALFQVPTYARGYAFSIDSYLAAPPSGIEMHVLPQAQIFRLARQHGLMPLEVEQDRVIDGWCVSHTFLFQKMRGPNS